MFKDLQSEMESIVTSCMEISYYSKGSISYERALMLSPGERFKWATFLQDRIKEEAKHPKGLF